MVALGIATPFIGWKLRGAVTHPIDRAGTVFPRGTGRFLVKKGVHIASFRCLSDETLRFFRGGCSYMAHVTQCICSRILRSTAVPNIQPKLTYEM